MYPALSSPSNSPQFSLETVRYFMTPKSEAAKNVPGHFLQPQRLLPSPLTAWMWSLDSEQYWHNADREGIFMAKRFPVNSTHLMKICRTQKGWWCNLAVEW